MNLEGLVKVQKHYLVLGVIAAVVLLCLAVLGIRFSLSSVTKANEELLDLSSKIQTADNVLSKSSHTSADYDSSVQILKECLDKIPPERDYYSWASQMIYAAARATGLEVDTIDEVNPPVSRVGGTQDEISFRSYSLRITARGGYAKTKLFLSMIEQEQPLARFSGMEIRSGPNPEVHNVQLFLQWPFNLSMLTAVWDEVETKQKAIARQTGYRRNPAQSGSDRNGSSGTEIPESETSVPEHTPDGSDINSHQDGDAYALLAGNAKNSASRNEHGSENFRTMKTISSQRNSRGDQ